MTMNTQAHRTLGAIVKQTDQLAAVRKNELRFGDRVVVTTRNSTYSIQVLHHNKRLTFVMPDVVDDADVRMVQ